MPDTLTREDRAAAVGLLETLRRNAGFTDGTERNINAIVGFMVGVRLAHIDALLASVEAMPGLSLHQAEGDTSNDFPLVERAAVLAILRGEQ